jgi:hypothetical protein
VALAVYEPTLYAYAYVLPQTISGTTIYEPSLTVGSKFIEPPYIPSGTTVHEPKMAGGISVPTVPGGTIIYGPSITLEAPLEIVGFVMGIRQDTDLAVGIRTDMSQSLLLQNI